MTLCFVPTNVFSQLENVQFVAMMLGMEAPALSALVIPYPPIESTKQLSIVNVSTVAADWILHIPRLYLMVHLEMLMLLTSDPAALKLKRYVPP